MDAASISTLVSQHGVTVVMLGVFIYGGWRICGWLAKNVIEPGMSSHQQFLTRTADCLESHTDYLKDLKHESADTNRKVTAIHGTVTRNGDHDGV